MDLATSIARFATGAAILDVVTPQLLSMTTQAGPLSRLSVIPGMSGVSATINSMIAYTTAQWNSILSQMPVALPAMKATHILENKMMMATSGGVAPTQIGSASFQAYFGSINTVKTQIANLSGSVSSSINSLGSTAATIPGVTGTGVDALNSLAGVIPPQTTTDTNGNTITNPAYTQFMSANSTALSGLTSGAGTLSSAVSTANTAVTSTFNAASAAYASGISNLRGMAFANFCARPQPQAVADVISQNIDAASIPSQNTLDQASRSVQTWTNAQPSATTALAINSPVTPDPDSMTPPNSESLRISPSPTSSTPPNCTPTQLAAIQAQIDAQEATYKQLGAATEPLRKAAYDYAQSLNWDKIAANKYTDRATYNAVKNQYYDSPQYTAFDDAYGAESSALTLLTTLKNIQHYMQVVGPLPSNPNGPWKVDDWDPINMSV